MTLHYNTPALRNVLGEINPNLYLYTLNTVERTVITDYLESLFDSEGMTPEEISEAVDSAYDETLRNLPIHLGY